MSSVPSPPSNTAAPTGGTSQPATTTAPTAPTGGGSQLIPNTATPANGTSQPNPQQTQIGQTNSNLSLPAWPMDLPLTERFMNDLAWPASLRLDLEKANWDEWSHRMRNTARRNGFCYWLDATFTPPDLTTEAG